MPSLFLLTKTCITRTGAENHVTNLLITRTTFSEFGIKIPSNWYQNQSSKSKCNFNNWNQTPVDIIMNTKRATTLTTRGRRSVFLWEPKVFYIRWFDWPLFKVNQWGYTTHISIIQDGGFALQTCRFLYNNMQKSHVFSRFLVNK